MRNAIYLHKQICLTIMSNTTEMAILEAAEKEFFNKGYAAARTTSIAEAAGVTHSMLHYYYRTKEQLFERIVASKMEYLSKTLLTPFGDPTLPLMERLRKGISNHFDFLVENPDLPRFILNEVAAESFPLDWIKNVLTDTVSSLVANLQKSLDESALQGKTVKVNAQDLMLDIVSMNVFLFVGRPLVKIILPDSTKDQKAFLEERKAESIETIMKRLKK